MVLCGDTWERPSQMSHRIPEAPIGFQRLPLDSRGSHWNPDYPRGSYWIPEDPSGFQRIPPDSRSSHWIPEAPNAFQRIPVDSRGSHQTPKAPSGFQRLLLDSGGSHRIPEDPTRFQNLPPDSRNSHLPGGSSQSKGLPGISPATFHTRFSTSNPREQTTANSLKTGNDPWIFHISLNVVGMWKHSQFYPKDVELVIPAPNHLRIFYISLEIAGIFQMCQNSVIDPEHTELVIPEFPWR